MFAKNDFWMYAFIGEYIFMGYSISMTRKMYFKLWIAAAKADCYIYAIIRKWIAFGDNL